MPQTSYALDNTKAIAGQIVSKGYVLGKYVASEEIAPGLMCELHTDGKLRVYRGGKKVGIATYRSAKEPGAWAADDYVPVLRSGQIWASLTGAAGADLTDANFSYASSTTTHRGKVTSAAVAGTTDAQVYDGGACKFLGSTATDGLALLECNFAGEQSLPEAVASSLISQSSNDYAIPAVHGQVYEINTSAANSTVSLPAAAPTGTVCYILADGTKNGHTLTFRDVTTAISAATTASKRVAAVAMKGASAWAVTLTVGP